MCCQAHEEGETDVRGVKPKTQQVEVWISHSFYSEVTLLCVVCSVT